MCACRATCFQGIWCLLFQASLQILFTQPCLLWCRDNFGGHLGFVMLLLIAVGVIGGIISEGRELCKGGCTTESIIEYFSDNWNLLDWARIGMFVGMFICEVHVAITASAIQDYFNDDTITQPQQMERVDAAFDSIVDLRIKMHLIDTSNLLLHLIWSVLARVHGE